MTATRWIPAAYSGGLAAVVLGPLFGPGYLLVRDAVSTPRSYLTDVALGLGDAAPRAVPQDAAIAVASAAADGGLVVKAILFAALWTAGWGAAVLARTLLGAGVGAQVAAATVAVWNPYVAERLLQGHWSLLTGYAALPWVAVLASRMGGWRDWAGLAGWLAAAGLTPTGGLLAGFTALAAARTRRPAVAGLAVLTWLPWLVATAAGADGSSDPAGVAAFAARAEPGLGTAGSVLGLGGIWNAAAVPGSRTGWFAAAATAVLLGVVGTGLVALFRRGSWRIPAVRALLMLAAGSLGLIVAGATPAGLTVGQWLVERVPGTGLFRDTQKFAALAVPGYALAAAACAALVSRTTRAGSTRDLRWVASAGLCGAVIAVLPDLAFGVGGNLRPVTYPAGWGQVAAAARAVDGDVAVLPAGMFRRFRYSGSAPVLDPAPRMLPKAVLQTGALPVAGRTVAGESRHAATVESALLHGDSRQRLAALGVGAVLVEHGTPGPSGRAAATLAQLRPLYSDADLTLYAVANPVVRPAPRRELVYLAHGLWAAALLLGATALLPRVRRRASSRMTEAVTNLQNDP